jgi:hypothetical protein
VAQAWRRAPALDVREPVGARRAALGAPSAECARA